MHLIAPCVAFACVAHVERCRGSQDRCRTSRSPRSSVTTAGEFDARQGAKAGVVPLRGRQLAAHAARHGLATTACTSTFSPKGCKRASHVIRIRSTHGHPPLRSVSIGAHAAAFALRMV